MIKLIKSTFYKEKETKEKLVQFIKSDNYLRFLSFGDECQKFEKNFAKYQGRKYCVFFNSGSTANLALIQALKNLREFMTGDKVAFSQVTWSTNVMPLIQHGLVTVPVDVELETLNISSRKVMELPLSTKVVFITNLLGFCDDIDEIKKICQEKNIILIEDNCESLGSIYQGKKLGNFGFASTFSFYVGHHLSTIEGGAVCTDDEELALMLRIDRAHGWDRNLSSSYQNTLRKKYKVNSSFYANYTFYDLGYNFRPTEINGFIGNLQLEYLDEILTKRNNNFLKLAKAIYGHTDKFNPIKYEHMDFVSNFAFPLICRTKRIRENLVKRCEGKLEIRPIVGGDITQQPFYKKYVKSLHFQKSNASIIHNQGLYFGNYPELTVAEIERIVKIVTEGL